MSWILLWLPPLPRRAPPGGPRGLGTGDTTRAPRPLSRHEAPPPPPPGAAQPRRSRRAGPQPRPRHLLQGSRIPAPRPAPAPRPRPAVPPSGVTGARAPAARAASAAELTAGSRAGGERVASRARSTRGPGAGARPTRGGCFLAGRRADHSGTEMLLLRPGPTRGRGRGRPAGAPRCGLSPPWSPAWICCWALAGCQAAWAGDLPSSSGRPLPPCLEVSGTWSFTWSLRGRGEEGAGDVG